MPTEFGGPSEKDLGVVEGGGETKLSPELQRAGEMFGIAERAMKPSQVVDVSATTGEQDKSKSDPKDDRRKKAGLLVKFFGAASLVALSSIAGGCAEGKGPRREGSIPVPSSPERVTDSETTYRVDVEDKHYFYDRTTGDLVRKEEPTFEQDARGRRPLLLITRFVYEKGMPGKVKEETQTVTDPTTGNIIRSNKETRTFDDKGNTTRDLIIWQNEKGEITTELDRENQFNERGQLEKSTRWRKDGLGQVQGTQEDVYSFDPEGRYSTWMQKHTNAEGVVFYERSTTFAYFEPQKGSWVTNTTETMRDPKTGDMWKVREEDYDYDANGAPTKRTKSIRGPQGLHEITVEEGEGYTSGWTSTKMTYERSTNGNLLRITVDRDRDGKPETYKLTEEGQEIPINE